MPITYKNSNKNNVHNSAIHFTKLLRYNSKKIL